MVLCSHANLALKDKTQNLNLKTNHTKNDA